MTKLPRIFYLPLHPFLFALYMVLAVAATDPSLVFFFEGGRAVIVMVIIAGFSITLACLLTTNLARAGYLTTLLIFWVFLYGHLQRALLPYRLGRFSIADERWFFPFWTILIVCLASGWVWKRIQKPEMVTRTLNLVALLAIAVPLFTVIRIGTQLQSDPLIDWKPASIDLPELNPTHRPDIFYIILDGYGRHDMLTELYGYDNTNFISELESLGFYVADQSRSNYMRTSMSVSSTLNYSYLDDLGLSGQQTANWLPLKELIHHSQIRRVLSDFDYLFITYDTGFHYTDIRDSDLYLSPYLIHLSSFEQMILGVSALEIAARAGFLDVAVFSYTDHRNRLMYTFEQLASIPLTTQPKFVFAHILIPHPPFVFDSSGKSIEPLRGFSMADGTEFEGGIPEYISGYREQLDFTNQKILQTIREILGNSSEPPVIILQGDHGPGAYMDWQSLENTCLYERLSIFNAYYLPGVPDDALYTSITPVNSFRIILNSYFDAGLPLLEDKSYASYGDEPYIFKDITDQIKPNCHGIISLP